MGATEEQMALLSGAHVSHVSYILLLYSVSFLLFLFVCMLLQLYATYAWPIDASKPKNIANGSANGHILQADSRVRDAEEFELEGLMSEDGEDEDVAAPQGRGKENGRVT